MGVPQFWRLEQHNYGLRGQIDKRTGRLFAREGPPHSERSEEVFGATTQADELRLLQTITRVQVVYNEPGNEHELHVRERSGVSRLVPVGAE